MGFDSSTTLYDLNDSRAEGSPCVAVEPLFPEVQGERVMRRFCALGLALLFATAGLMAAELTSGLQVGEHAGAFNVKDITGPRAGKSLCYR